jgi:hypothetical protein
MRSNLSDVITGAEVIIVSKKEKEYVEALRNVGPEVKVIDLVRLPGIEHLAGYDGICW